MSHQLLVYEKSEYGECICRCSGKGKSEEEWCYPSDGGMGSMSACFLLKWMNLSLSSYVKLMEQIGPVENMNIYQNLFMVPEKQAIALRHLPAPYQAVGIRPWGQEVEVWYNVQQFPPPRLQSKPGPCKHFCKFQSVYGLYNQQPFKPHESEIET